MKGVTHEGSAAQSDCGALPRADGFLIGMISNPNSGRNRKQLGDIEAIVADHPCIHHRRTPDPQSIAAVLAEFAQAGVTAVAINGGDGTVAQVLTELLERSPFERLPLVILLPGGTTNMNAGDVGVRGGLRRAVKRLARWSRGEAVPCRLLRRPVLRVEPGGGRAAVCGMFFGAGAIIQGIEYCHARLHSRGIGSEIGPGLAMARTVWGIVRRDPRFVQAVPVAVSLDDQPAGPARDALLLLVSGLERLFLGMHPYWGREHGPLHFSLIRNGASRFLRNLPSLLRGKAGRQATQAAGYSSHNVARLSLTMDGVFTLDGDMYSTSKADGPVIIRSGGDVTFVRL